MISFQIREAKHSSRRFAAAGTIIAAAPTPFVTTFFLAAAVRACPDGNAGRENRAESGNASAAGAAAAFAYAYSV
ncbi:hypothetical protein [Noviherbaspirillum galbum]|uniref:Uncharacterized protein n=1 Tax=Noviherbaspirillum galbum TaxID=2709383 RepID=A0A6B3SJZ1_9BURK|nr:hypothetical protein [Noviherbaspirillum galbum]NEX61174.1 hypothetical protein [Noviherbaspirillum galbum]